MHPRSNAPSHSGDSWRVRGKYGTLAGAGAVGRVCDWKDRACEDAIRRTAINLLDRCLRDRKVCEAVYGIARRRNDGLAIPG
jgi:hypothetical protein